MNDPRLLSIQQFTYTLPENRIAHHPLPRREDSKLLVYGEGKIVDNTYSAIAEHLPANSLLVFNDTRVFAARLLFQKETRGVVEIFCLSPADEKTEISTAMKNAGSVQWKCLVGGASKWKPGQVLEKRMTNVILRAKYLEKLPDGFVIELSWTPGELSFSEILQKLGATPLPPYIKRSAEAEDVSRYQTVFAKAEGSVAAPTAGLHFSESVMKELGRKNIETSFLTLHVGAGTFKPVKSEKIGGHVMHSEWIELPLSLLEKLRQKTGEKIIAVGTTSLRTLESIYWIGRKLALGADRIEPLLQWEAYEAEEEISTEKALDALIQHLRSHKLEKLITQTGILIAPGYRFRLVNGLVTNFHQPNSTLLLLIAAFIGDEWRKVYDHALQNNYRFLSYGDGSLLFPLSSGQTLKRR
jgi:S-adenosylmethionine:tRNA ribosyltransferase-isomerase